MVYRKKAYRKSPRRTHYLKNTNTMANIAYTSAKALSTAYAVKKLLNVEHKYVDYALNQNVGYDAPIYLLLNGIAQGDGATTRDGNSVKMEYVDLNLTLQNATASDRTVRIMLVQQKDVNGLAPVISEILQDSATQYAPLSHYNRDQINNYRVLYDRRFSTADVTSDKAIKQINIKRKFGKDSTAKIRFDGVLATVANMSKNSLYLIVTSDNVFATNPPTLKAKSRLTYLDN